MSPAIITGGFAAIPKHEMVSRFYLRFTVADHPGVLASITGILSKLGVSISGVYQPENAFSKRGVPIMLLTHPVQEGTMELALKGNRQESPTSGPGPSCTGSKSEKGCE